MRTPPCLLVVDDEPTNVDILRTRLTVQGYDVLTAVDGPSALALATTAQPDLILLDIRLPTMDGLTVCRALKADTTLPFIPIILLTAKTDPREVVAGVDAEAQEQAMQAAQWAAWSRTLEQRLQGQITALERLGGLKEFPAPGLAELVVSPEGAVLFQHQQRVVTVLCCTLQGFAAFVATATPMQVVAVLEAYEAVVGAVLEQGEGTVTQQTDGRVQVVFNAPLACADPAGQVVHMAMALRDQLAPVCADWQAQPYALACGLGIAQGEASVGLWRGVGGLNYAVLGPVTAVAMALSDAAADGQILLTPTVAAAVAGQVATTPVVLHGPRGVLSGGPILQVDTSHER